MRTVLIKLIFVAVVSSVYGQVNAQDIVLEGYIRQGLDSNLVVMEKNISMEKAMNALEVAKNMYLPNVSFDLQYTTASGGRSIDLPVGDLLNPVYSTLNQLTGSSAFPAIRNEQINFLPMNYYDARIRTVVPIINTDIKHGRDIRTQAVELSRFDMELYQRELVKEIKIAYYNYINSLNAIAIYKNSLSLANEGRRVNQKLLEAGKGLHAYVIRSDAEVAQQEAKIIEAEQQSKNAKYYFNVLLNRQQEDSITVEIGIPDQVSTALTADADISRREELSLLEQQLAIQETMVKMNKQVYMPKLNAFLDLGSQAEGLRVGRDAAYYMIGAQLTFPIFSGNKNKLKIQESQLQVIETQNKIEQAKQQLSLAAGVALNEVIAQTKALEAAKVQLEAASTYRRLVDRGFTEGVNTYLETMDARAQLTNAQLAQTIASTKLLVATAKFERETAAYPL